MLNMGDAGSGKTGALASLAKAGQRLVILDFDNGLDILIGLLKNDQKALEHIYYETFTDELMMGPQSGSSQSSAEARKRTTLATLETGDQTQPS
jgi:hypothetical protein